MAKALGRSNDVHCSVPYIRCKGACSGPFYVGYVLLPNQRVSGRRVLQMSTESLENGKAQKRRKTKQKPLLERAPKQQQATEDGNSKFARALGSTDYATREKGVQALSKFLIYKKELPELDIMKLWKGLFFCFWHSDKVAVQTELAERLAGLLPQMHPHMAQLFWAGMLTTLRREWFAMDHHRLDKFLMLVRKFIAALLTRLQADQWDVATIQRFTLNLPMEETLVPPTSAKSLGLSYHIADVWLQELRRIAATAASDHGQIIPHDSMLQLLEPFVRVLETSREQALLTRVKESVFDELASDILSASAAAGASSSNADEGDHAEQHIYCQQLDVEQLAALLFERGAADDVKARNRQLLYTISKELEKAPGRHKKRAAAAANGDSSDQHQQAKQKKQKVRHLTLQQQNDNGQVDMQQEQHLQQAVLDTSAPGKRTKKHKHPPAAHVQGFLQQHADVSGVTPSGSQTQAIAQQRQRQVEVLTDGTSPAAAADVTPQAATDSAAKSSKKRRKSATAAAPSGQTEAKPAATADYPDGSRRGVVINLQKNVYFAHGAPVPPEAVRTPPPAKPKGSALKASSQTVPVRKLSSRLDAVAGAQERRHKPVTPNSVPRVKAAAFF